MTVCADCNQPKLITVATEFGRLCYTCFFSRPEVPAIADQHNVPIDRTILNQVTAEAANYANRVIGPPNWPDFIDPDAKEEL